MQFSVKTYNIIIVACRLETKKNKFDTPLSVKANTCKLATNWTAAGNKSHAAATRPLPATRKQEHAIFQVRWVKRLHADSCRPVLIIANIQALTATQWTLASQLSLKICWAYLSPAARLLQPNVVLLQRRRNGTAPLIHLGSGCCRFKNKIQLCFTSNWFSDCWRNNWPTQYQCFIFSHQTLIILKSWYFQNASSTVDWC